MNLDLYIRCQTQKYYISIYVCAYAPHYHDYVRYGQKVSVFLHVHELRCAGYLNGTGLHFAPPCDLCYAPPTCVVHDGAQGGPMSVKSRGRPQHSWKADI